MTKEHLPPLSNLLTAAVAMLMLGSVSYSQEARRNQAKKATVANASELRYQLKVPKGWEYWVLADSAETADSIYTFAGDPPTRGYIQSHIASGKLKIYQPGEIGVLTGSAKQSGAETPLAYCIMVVSEKGKDDEGWVSKELVELTPESRKIKTQHDAVEKRIKAERDAAEAEQQKRMKAKLREACGSVYKNTIDKKINDLTVRESDEIKTCRALGLYPP
jgi:hypothetical protein